MNDKELVQRKRLNADLNDKPSGVSDSVWQAFKDKRERERQQILLDESGKVGNIKYQ